MTTEIETTEAEAIQLTETLEMPVIPPEFVHNFMVCQVGDRICEELDESKIDKPSLKKLFDAYSFGTTFVINAAQNGGMVSHFINSDAVDCLVTTLNTLAKIGYKF